MSCDMLLWPSWPTTHLHHQQNHDKGSGDNHQGKKKKVSVLTFRTLWQKLEVCLCGHQYIYIHSTYLGRSSTTQRNDNIIILLGIPHEVMRKSSLYYEENTFSSRYYEEFLLIS